MAGGDGSDGDEFCASGAEVARRAADLRSLVQAYLTGTFSLEIRVRDATWELGVSAIGAPVWRWTGRLTEEGG